MAAAVTPPDDGPKVGLVRAGIDYYHSVMAEMHKVTWPDRQHVRQATQGIIIFVLAIGAMISLMDVALNGVLIQLLPRLFSGR